MENKWWKNKKILSGISVVVVLMVFFCRKILFEPSEYSGTAFVMGTVFQFSVKTREEDPVPHLISIGSDFEKNILSWRDQNSQIAKINEDAGKPEGTELTEEMEELLTTCFEVSKASGGAFDITLGTLTSLWDIDNWASGENEAEGYSFEPPSEEEVKEALSFCGYEKVRIENHRIYLPEGMKIDLGAVGKGLYLDKCKTVVPKDTNGIISAGGSIVTLGQKAGAELWNVGITDPFNDGALFGQIAVNGGKCVSTSGDYERYVECKGVRYHHILDPATGYPVGITPGQNDEDADLKTRSVTIVTESGLMSDILSTACFILDEKQAIALAEHYDADIIIIREDASIVGSGECYRNIKQY